jgi:hypothetical protein
VTPALPDVTSINQPGAVNILPSGFAGDVIGQAANRFQGPLSWWRGQLKAKSFGAWLQMGRG